MAVLDLSGSVVVDASSTGSLDVQGAVLSILCTNYVPPRIRDFSLYQKVCEILDFVRKRSNAEFNNSKSKYFDFNDLDDDAVKDVINEFGYGYIVDALELSQSQLRSMLGYIALIHLLKGSKIGLQLVLDLMGLTGKYIISEWWEDTSLQPGEFSFLIDVTTFGISNLASLDTLRVFVRQYVYPKMTIQDSSGLTGYGYSYGNYYGGVY